MVSAKEHQSPIITVNGITGSNHCLIISSESNNRGENLFRDAANESAAIIDMSTALRIRPLRQSGEDFIAVSCVVTSLPVHFLGRAKQLAPLALDLSSHIGWVKYSRFLVPGFSPASSNVTAARIRSCPCSVAL